jgi:hypothetical protein
MHIKERVIFVIAFTIAAAAFAGRTERVSVSSSGEEGNGNSEVNAISADGRFVVFWSATGVRHADVRNANDELARGDGDIASQKLESGIEHDRNAWQHAQN